MMKKFFLKRFRTYFISMIVPLIIFCSITLIITNHYIEAKVRQQSTVTLSHVEDNFEFVVNNSTFQYELLTNTPTLVISLRQLLTQESFNYSDIVFIYNIKTLLGASVSSEQYIDSIYLYLDGYENFFSSQDDILKVDAHADNNWFTIYQASSPEVNKWIVKRSLKEFTYTESKNVISLFHRMASTSGVIVININSSRFEQTLNNSISENNELLFLLDTNNQILCSSTNQIPLSEIELKEFTSKLQSINRENLSTYNDQWITLDGNKYLMKTLLSSIYETSFIALVPYSNVFQQTKIIWFLFILILFFNCIVTSFLAYSITKKYFNQINYIIDVFWEAEHGHLLMEKETPTFVNDEFDVILSNVIKVFLESNHLHQELVEKDYLQQISELASLQLQINPHFLFNTLQVLDFEVLKHMHQPSTINKIIHNLSDILKYSLEDCDSDITIQEEINYLKKYTEIQAIRYGEKFIMYYEVDDAILNYQVFRLMLQPLIENSICHGISPLEETGYIKLKIYKRRNQIYFTVIDTGVGLSEESIAILYQRFTDKKSKNIGITNLNRRLLLRFGPDSQLRIRSRVGVGTSISFHIPAIEKGVQNL